MRRFKFDGPDARKFVLDLMKTGNGKVPRDIPTEMIPVAARKPDSAAAPEPRHASRVPVPDDEEDSEEDESDEIRVGDFRFKCMFDDDQWWCQKCDLSSLELLSEKPLPSLQTKNGRTKGLGFYQFKREDGDILVWAGTKATTRRLDALFQEEEEEDDVENGEDGGDTPDYNPKAKRPVGTEAAEGDSEPALKKARKTQTAKDLAPGVSAAPAILRGMKAEKNNAGPQRLAENQTC